MGKLLKPLVYILFLLSVLSLVLGINLFNKREIYKGRDHKFTQAVNEFSQNIRYEGKIDSTQLGDYAGMDVPLKSINAAGANLYANLQDTKQELDVTKQDLTQTKEELSTETARADSAESEVESKKQIIAQQEDTIADKEAKVEDLTSQNEEAQVEIEGLNEQVVDAGDKYRDLQADHESLKQQYDEILATTSDPGSDPVVPKGTAGEIVFVNPDWNFVILDIGKDKKLLPGAVMLIHREDNLIGKVRISDIIKEDMCVALIDQDWTQKSVKKGDHVFH